MACAIRYQKLSIHEDRGPSANEFLSRKTHLATLVANGLILREGAGLAARYTIAAPATPAVSVAAAALSLPWSTEELQLRAQLQAPAGEKERQLMRRKIDYTDEPMEARFIQDFLPPPEELAFREEGVKVTLALSKKSVKFFKAEAARQHTQHQRMIRKLIDSYVGAHSKPDASGLR